jgi:hypothetical protein
MAPAHGSGDPIGQESGMADSKQTTNHDEIRKWTEARGGKPAVVKPTHKKGGGGILRIEFPNAPEPHDENLETIQWDEFFRIFDRESRFFKFVERS